MPFKVADMDKEKKMLDELLETYAEAREAHEEFLAEYRSKARKDNTLNELKALENELSDEGGK